MASIKHDPKITREVVINGTKIRFTKDGLYIGEGLDAVYIRGDGMRILDPTEKVRGHYPDMYPWTSPRDPSEDDLDIDLTLSRDYPYDGVPVDQLPRIIRSLKSMILGNVSIKANFEPRDEITGEYTGTIQKGDLVKWDPATSQWVQATTPSKARGIADTALFTGVAFPEADEIMSSASVTCDVWNLTPGQAYYLDPDNPGKITDVDTGFFVGLAQSTQTMYFSPYASSLEQYLEKLSQSVSDNKAELTTIQEQFGQVQDTVAQLEEIVTEVKTNTDTFDTRITEINDKAEEARTKAITAMETCAQLQAKDVEFQGYFNKIAGQFQTVSTTITNMTDMLTDSDTEIRGNIDAVQIQVNRLETLLGSGKESVTQMLATMRSDITALDTRLTNSVNDIEASQITQNTAIAENKASIDGLTTDVAQCQTDLVTLNSDITTISASVTANTKNIGALSGRVTTLQSSVTSNIQEIANNAARIAEVKAIADSNMANYQLVSQELAALTTTVTDQDNKLAADISAVILVNDEQTKQLQQGKDIVTNLHTRVISIENMLETIPDGSGCTCDFTAINQGIADNTTNLNNLKTFTNSIYAKVNKNSDAIKAIQEGGAGGGGTTSAEVAQIRQDLVSVAATTESLSNANTLMDQRVTANATNLTALQGKVTANETALATNTANLATIQSSLAENKTQLDNLKTAVEQGGAGDAAAIKALSDRVDTIGTAQTAQEQLINNNTLSLTAVTSDINTLKTTVTGLQTSITAATTAATKASSDVAGLETRMALAEGELTEITKNVSEGVEVKLGDINKAVGDNTALIANIQTTNTSLASRVSELERNPAVPPTLTTDVETLKTEVQTLKNAPTVPEFVITDITALQTANTQLQTKVTALETTVANLTTRLAQAETALTTANNSITALQAVKWGTTSANKVTALTAAEIDGLPVGGFISTPK